ncbi:hypothetical protein FRC09_009227 [Ceratobasidium sp. 395]|nr:hypothetical protein FRC09_009227 [Ceratobasidium sp. 395]
MTTEAYLKATSVTDWDIQINQLTKAMAKMRSALGKRKGKSKRQTAGDQPPAEPESQTEPGSGAAMGLDEHQEGDEGSQSDESSGADSAEDIHPVSGLPTGILGDSALGNAILLMRDAFWYLEFATAVSEGDIGRVFEIIKVLRFLFWGGGATNYGNELLELACNYFYEYPDKLQDAIWNNYLVNPSGLPNHWHELDLLQEHHNLWIKTLFNKKNSDFDSNFLRKAVSLNIRGLAQLRNHLFQMLGLSATPTGQSLPDYEHDIDVLATHYRRNNLFIFTAGRSQSFAAVDTFSQGYEKLESGTLAKFLDRTLMDPDEIYGEDEDLLDLEELSDPPVPLASENGVLRAAEGPALNALLNLYQ